MAKKNTSMIDDLLNGKKPKKSTPAQLHKSTDAQSHPNLPDVRLHCFIRGNLADWIDDEILRRKKDRSISNKSASKRAIVEDALVTFFR